MDKIDRVDGVDKLNRADGVDKINRVDGVDKIDRVDGVDKIDTFIKCNSSLRHESTNGIYSNGSDYKILGSVTARRRKKKKEKNEEASPVSRCFVKWRFHCILVL